MFHALGIEKRQISRGAALRACRSAIFFLIVKIRIFTRFYKCLLNPSKVFLKSLCFYVSNLASHHQRKGPFHLTGAQLVCSWETAMSVVLKPFHVKDPQNDMYLATDPHLKIFSSRDHPEVKFEFTNVCFENTYIQRFAHIFTTFSRVADLQARSARGELVYLLFFTG
jgi:hypothetical protein